MLTLTTCLASHAGNMCSQTCLPSMVNRFYERACLWSESTCNSNQSKSLCYNSLNVSQKLVWANSPSQWCLRNSHQLLGNLHAFHSGAIKTIHRNRKCRAVWCCQMLIGDLCVQAESEALMEDAICVNFVLLLLSNRGWQLPFSEYDIRNALIATSSAAPTAAATTANEAASWPVLR